MAAPDNINIKAMNGTIWTANKALSGDSDSVLALQGVHYFVRTIISSAQITVCINQRQEEDGTTHLEIQNLISVGLPGITDTYQTDWKSKEYYDTIFGNVRDRARWVNIDLLEDEYQREGWEDGSPEVLELFTDHLDIDATTSQVCGFELIEGERRYTRRLVVNKGKEVSHVRLVFDYVGSNVEQAAENQDDLPKEV